MRLCDIYLTSSFITVAGLQLCKGLQILWSTIKLWKSECISRLTVVAVASQSPIPFEELSVKWTFVSGMFIPLSPCVLPSLLLFPFNTPMGAVGAARAPPQLIPDWALRSESRRRAQEVKVLVFFYKVKV